MNRHTATTQLTLIFSASVLFSGMSTTLASAAPSANSLSGVPFRSHTSGRLKSFTEPIPTPVFAGGGSVPALTLRAWGNLYGVTPGQPDPPYGPLVEVLYAASTGGTGQRWFLNQAFDAMSMISSNPPYTDITNGRDWTFPYPNASGPATFPDFAVGSQLSKAELKQYRNSDQQLRGPAIVKPLVETALALGFNLGPYSQLGSRQLELSRASYCGIYTGAITDWSDPQITADNGGVPVVSQATTIDAVYRSDGSGTTFMFTDHLNDVCPAAGKPYSQGVGETFNLPNPQPPGSSFVGAAGGSAMVTAILTPANPMHGAVGYLTPSFVKPLNANGPPAALAINARGFAIAPTAQSAFYAAKFGPFAKPPPGYPQTMPHTYLTNPMDYRAYPITGMVMMYFYKCYPNSDSDVAAMQGFFGAALAPDFRGMETPYDVLANQNGLGQLPGFLKQSDLRSINAIKLIPPSSRCS